MGDLDLYPEDGHCLAASFHRLFVAVQGQTILKGFSFLLKKISFILVFFHMAIVFFLPFFLVPSRSLPPLCPFTLLRATCDLFMRGFRV